MTVTTLLPDYRYEVSNPFPQIGKSSIPRRNAGPEPVRIPAPEALSTAASATTVAWLAQHQIGTRENDGGKSA